MLEVRRHALAVAQARAGRALTRPRFRDLGLAVGVEGVVQRAGEQQFLVIVRHGELEPADQRVESTRLLAARAAGWDVGVADDAAHFHQRGVAAERVAVHHHLEGALVPLVTVLRAAHVERMAVQPGEVGGRLDEHELCLRIDELADQPRAGRAVNMGVPAGNPPHGMSMRVRRNERSATAE